MNLHVVLLSLLISAPCFAGLTGVFEAHDGVEWYGEMTVVEYQRINELGNVWISWNTIVPGNTDYGCGYFAQLVGWGHTIGRDEARVVLWDVRDQYNGAWGYVRIRWDGTVMHTYIWWDDLYDHVNLESKNDSRVR